MEAAITTKAAASPLVVSIGDTASLPSAKSPDTGQMRSSSPFTPNSFPTHKTTSLMSTSSPPAATTAGSPLQNETHLSPSKEPSLVTDQLQSAASVAIHENSDSPASSLSDVETFNGKIVYNPDGSAYIIEGPDSDGSDVEAEISQEGSIIDARGLSPDYGSISFPQIVSAFHISRSSTSADLYSALCGQAALTPKNSSNEASKVPEVPVMHSYRVFSLRNKKEEPGEEEYRLDDATEEDEEDAKLRATNCSTVPVKPILMCFICKLSFGYSKSFVAHAIGEHHLSLNEEETRVLSAKNTSAIIQGVGKEKEPLLSFLKPNSFPAPFTSGPSQSCQQQQIDAQRLLAVQMAAVASALRSSSLAPPSTAAIPESISPAPSVPSLSSPKLASPCNATATIEEQTQTTLNASESQAGNDVPPTSASFSSSSFDQSSDHNKSVSSSRSSSSSDHGHSMDMSSPLDSGLAGSNKQSTTQAEASSQFASELADLANLEKFAKAAAAAAQQQMDLQSIAAAMAAAVAVSSNASTGQLRTPSPGSKNSPKSPAVSAQSVLLSGQLSNAASTFGAAINSAAVSLMSNDTKAAMSIFSTAADNETPTLLATTIANHVARPTMTTGSHPPLLMQHSRNSCKTLKCPKCNWHYKYQETLEIHMKEKHPENEMNCIYCLTNQPHPRLARGETYTCGYKPYRCDVCNYSTTTKGNLSIHMQSDKHINNVQELQNGNIPATAEHLLQSQALAAAVAQCSAAAAAAANGTGQSNSSAVVTTASGAMVSGGSTSVVSPASTPAVNLAAMAVAAAAQQDAKNHQLQKMQSPQVSTQVTTVATTISSPSSSNSANGKQKATWRCDVCNYETNVARNLRIHMTSEKHTHNIMVLRQNVNQMQQISTLQQAGIITPEQLLQFNPGLLAAAAAAAAGMNGQANATENGGGGGGSLQPEAALADMAYNHALLMMASQQHQQRAMAAMLQQQQQMTLPESKSPLTPAPMMMMANGSQPTFDMEHPDPSLSGVASVPPCDDSCRMFHCCVCATFTSDSIETLSQHIQCDRTRTREDEVLASVGGSYICKLCSYKTNLKANFQLHCKTDKHLQRLQHVNHIKEGGHQVEWKLKFVNVSNPVQVRCNVCDYYTNSIHKLQLHTTNPRHDVRSRIFSHLQAASLELATTGNKCYYQCSLCNSSTRTKFALIQHINSVKHVRNDSLHQLKQQTTGGSVGVRDSEEEIREMFLIKELLPGEKVVFENDDDAHLSDMRSPQPLTGVTLESADPALVFKNALLDHSASTQLEAKLSIAVAESSGDQHSSPVSCPFCSFSTSSEMRMQMHILTSHHHQATGDQQAAAAVANALSCAPSILCPLCQEAFQEKARLENHLVRIHNVNEEGVQRLMLLVDTTELDKFLAAKLQKVQNDNSARRDAVASQEGDEEDDGRRSVSSGDSGSKLAEDELIEAGKFFAGNNASGTFFEYLLCPACNQMHLSLEDLFSHMTGEGHIKPIVGGQFQCWRSGCGQSFKSIAATQQHFKEQHFLKCIKLTNSSANLASNATVSDRHVYKYRCSQCSLAFKTYEKLELHMQYHLIRAATQCVICGRSFRSVEALQKHVESSHADMSEEELEQYKASLVSNQLLFAFGRNGGILDPSTTQLLKKESIRSDGVEDESMEIEDDALLDSQTNDDGLQSMDDSSVDNGINNCAMNGNASENSFEDYLNSQSLAEDNYNDPSRKFKCHRCKVAFTRQSYLTSHNKTLLHRKGEKMSYPMEKYLDPNRPFKCEICKESFTQKNILLVHYNSVSHLHKLKQSMKESSAAVAAAAAASSGNELSIEAQAGDVEGNRVFRCNLCKVSYAQASAFNSHLQSFAHKSRDSKFQELAISGQLDLSLPLIEHPETLQEANNNNPSKANANEQLSNKQQANTPSASPSPNSKLPDMLANLTEQQQQALAFQQAALNFALAAGQSGSGQSQLLQLASGHHQSPFTCGKCGAAFISQDAQLQHQQLCGLFGNQLQAIANSAPNSSQARQIKLPNFQAPICKSKPQLYKHLLETWGFEIVMQFNESHQKKKKLVTDVKVEEEVEGAGEDDIAATVEKPEVKTEPESETNAVEEDNSVPEINRCQCDICSKEFSSIWVLKAHREEIHKDVLPLDVVESFADEYRTEYERKFSNGNEDEAKASESNEQLSDNHAISNGIMNGSIDGSGGNNASHTLSASSSPVDDGSPISESAASMPPNANPTSPEAQNFSQFGLPNLPPNASPAEIAAANQMAAAQLQFGQLLMSMGLAGMAGMPMPGGMNMPFAAAAAMGIPPQLIPMMMADPMMAAAAAFNNPALAAAAAAQMNAAAQAPTSSSTPGTASPAPSNTAMSNVQPPVTPSQMNSQAAAVAAAAAAQQKRARTRISDEQLKVLRQYFDINNSPTEEQLIEMSQKSGLPMKVIKHWFRNTLFKERQRNKDSPYNFNNPPSTYLNLDEYEKTGEAKVFNLDEIKKEEGAGVVSPLVLENDKPEVKPCIKDKPAESESESESKNCSNDFKSSSSTKDTDYTTSDDEEMKRGRESKDILANVQANSNDLAVHIQKQQVHIQTQLQQQQTDFDQLAKAMSLNVHSPQHSESSMSSNSESTATTNTTTTSSLFAGLSNFGPGLSGAPNMTSSPLQFALDAAQRSQLAAAAAAAVSPGMLSNAGHSVSSHSSSGKRANRTRFTDYQIKVLQEFFESNAYPKDDDLEYLSKLLNLSPRVIVVWFQNARQKARKVYENQPASTPIETPDDGSGRFQRTPGLNYQCKKCLQVFQRYYELIKHQKSSCFKDENPLAAQIRMAAERAQATSPSLSTTRETSTPIDCSRSATATPEKVPTTNMLASPGSVSSASPAPSSTCSNHKSSPTSNAIGAAAESQTYRCDKCTMSFNRYDQWKEHQIVHQLVQNSSLFNSPSGNPFALIGQLDSAGQISTSHVPSSPQPLNISPSSIFPHGVKRKMTTTTTAPTTDDDDDESHDSMSGNGGSNSGDQTPRDKRLRTTILPEQLDYLYQKYQVESNPSRKMLESIAKEVGLKKRVVQVWFQNTRARERKGQFRAHQQVIHKRCPFCRALFKARSALESHLATRHADQYTKGDINIDALPDGDPSEDGDSSVNEPMDPRNMDNSQVADMMRQYYASCMGDLNMQGKDGGGLPAELAMKMKTALEQAVVASAQKQQHSATTSNAINLTPQTALQTTATDTGAFASIRQYSNNGGGEDEGFDDTRSEEFDSEAEEEIDFDYSQSSNPSSPSTPSGFIHGASHSAISGNSHRGIVNSNSKRFRTQMTTVMLKVMKSIFADYKTPTMAECEALGREIGLAKRVVQVWFQNARAKEKKARLQFAKTFGHELDASTPAIEECKICVIKYSKHAPNAMQEHLFTSGHIAKLKHHIDNIKKMIEGQDDNSTDFPVASGHPIPPTMLVNPHSTTNIFTGNGDPKKAVTFMQQLQLIQGLAAASQGSSALPMALGELLLNGSGGDVSGDASKKSFDHDGQDDHNDFFNSHEAHDSGPSFASFMFGAER